MSNLYIRYDADGDPIDTRDEEITKLKIELQSLKTKARTEEALRMKYSSLNDAYKKYRLILKLAESEERK